MEFVYVNLVRNFDSDVQTRNQEITELESRLEKENKVLEQITSEMGPSTKSIQLEIEGWQNKLVPHTTAANAHESRISILNSELDLLREKTTRLQLELDESRSKQTELEMAKREKVS